MSIHGNMNYNQLINKLIDVLLAYVCAEFLHFAVVDLECDVTSKILLGSICV